MTIEKKLLAGFGALLFVTIFLGIAAIRSIGNLGNNLDQMGHERAHLLYLTGDANKTTTDMLATMRGILARGYMKDYSKMQTYHEHFGVDVEKLRAEVGEIASSTKSPELKRMSQADILDNIAPVVQGVEEMYALSQKGDNAGAAALFDSKVNPLTTELSEHADSLAHKQEQVVAQAADEGSATVGPARSLSIALMLLSLVAGGVVLYIVRDITKTLRESIDELHDGADQVTTAASQVSSASQSLAQGASEQAASLEETSASSEEINSMARKNTDNSRMTAQLLLQSQEKVALANRHLAEMVGSMNEINESSGKISKIIKVIDEIAFQTNILALNAAVEAARAGEAGMGFAVVADEVRSLAQRSAQAAKDTAALIEDSISKSSEGKGKVDQVASAIRAITEDSARIKVMVDEVSLGSEEQSRGVDQIGKAIGQMEQVTQTSAASAEEAAASAEELSAQSEAMKDVVARLQAMVANSGDSRISRNASSFQSNPARKPGYMKPAGFSAKPVTVRQKTGSPQSAAYRPHGTSAVPSAVHAVRQEFPLEDSFQSF
jgi:methyl-accepting chemotaxis protein